MLWDTHMHTHFSGDSDAAPESMIQAAREKGLCGICFTDHLDLDYPKEPELFLPDLDAYFEKMQPLADRCAGAAGLPSHVSVCETASCIGHEPAIRIGIELGLQPHLASRLRNVTDSYPFDFVIGSSHLVHGMDPYYPEYFIGKAEDEAYGEYFTSILENIAVFDDFDVYGHIDYVVRYGPNKNKYYSYEKFQDVIDEILKALIARGKGIEINTGGLKYGLGHPNPTEAILKRYHKLGGEIITIGSDAHAPEHVAYDFDKVPGILREAGFKYFTVFKKRQPEFFLLP